MTSILITNETQIAPGDFATSVKATQKVAGNFATEWELGTVFLTQDATAHVDMKVRVTEVNRHTGAKGYHTVENGIPVSYCSPRASIGKLFGTYFPPVISKGIFSKGKVLFPARCRSGLTDIIIHEVVEMIADPLIKTLSEPDSLGHRWLVEPADPLVGELYMEVIDGKQVILPAFAYPAFYKLGSVGPWDTAGVCKGPFQIPLKSGYGFWVKIVDGIKSFVKV